MMYEDIKQSVVSHHSRVPIAQQRSKNTKVMGSVPGSVPTDKTCDLQVISDKAKCKQTKMIRSPWCTLNFSRFLVSFFQTNYPKAETVTHALSPSLLWYSRWVLHYSDTAHASLWWFEWLFGLCLGQTDSLQLSDFRGSMRLPPTTTTITITTPLEFAPQGYNRLIFQILFFQSCQHNHHSLVLMAAGWVEITTPGASLSTPFNLAKQQQALKHNNIYHLPQTLH